MRMLLQLKLLQNNYSQDPLQFLDCNQDIGTGGFADSNGDDNMALLNNGEIVDMFGVAGEDGTGTWHEFEDGRAERAFDSVSGCVADCEALWNIDNDSLIKQDQNGSTIIYEDRTFERKDLLNYSMQNFLSWIEKKDVLYIFGAVVLLDF